MKKKLIILILFFINFKLLGQENLDHEVKEIFSHLIEPTVLELTERQKQLIIHLFQNYSTENKKQKLPRELLKYFKSLPVYFKLLLMKCVILPTNEPNNQEQNEANV